MEKSGKEKFKMEYKVVYEYDPNATKKDIRKQKFEEAKRKVFGWCDRNKEWLIPLVPLVIGGGVATVKIAGKHANLNKEKNVKELFCYDRSLGHYWALKRRLTNAEWIDIDKRKAAGERLADILDELKVLK